MISTSTEAAVSDAIIEGDGGDNDGDDGAFDDIYFNVEETEVSPTTTCDKVTPAQVISVTD